MLYIAYLTYVLAGVPHTEPIAPVGDPATCYTVGVYRALERAAELKIPVSAVSIGCWYPSPRNYQK
jgi:hypothetical protein